MSSVTITLPLSDDAAKACVVAADCFGVEPWEIAAHVLSSPNWLRSWPAVAHQSDENTPRVVSEGYTRRNGAERA